MHNLEGIMAETGQIIQRRYLLQRLIKQGRVCAIYLGIDQVLQRAVAVKVVPAEHIPTYRAAIRATAQFSHPHIIGTYDVIIEPEVLYVIQEYVDGDDFSVLMLSSLTPPQVIDLGIQVCQALIYASGSSRKVCHGDLTPAAIIRDRRGLVRVNNFALPSDLQYFTQWSSFGGEGDPVSDQGLPWGQLSEGRRHDDTRAVGLLLYQLLSGRPAGTAVVEPPADGRLRFQRNVPPELCNIVARTVMRQHPEHIDAVETLHAELQMLAEAFDVPVPVSSAAYQTEEVIPAQQFSPARPIAVLPVREPNQAGIGLAAFREASPLTTGTEMSPAPPTIADMSPAQLVNAGQSAFSPMQNMQPEEVQPRRLNFAVIFLLGLLIFAVFFIIGFFLQQVLLPH